MKLVPLHNYVITVYCGNNGGFEQTGSTVTFMTNIPVPTVTVGTVSGTSVSMQWASDQYALWHRVEYAVQGSKRNSALVIVAAMQTGSGMTVTGLAMGTNFTFHVYAGQGASYYEPHGTSFTVQTVGSNDEDASGLSSGRLFFSLASLGMCDNFLFWFSLLVRCYRWSCDWDFGYFITQWCCFGAVCLSPVQTNTAGEKNGEASLGKSSPSFFFISLFPCSVLTAPLSSLLVSSRI